MSKDLGGSTTAKWGQPHDRTPVGRALLKVQRGVQEWINFNRLRATADELAEAERLSCDLLEAAWNGLATRKAALIEWADKTQMRRKQGTERREP